MNRLKVVALLLASVALLTRRAPLSADESAVFEKPVRLEAGGEVIDTGDKSGHAGPSFADADGDGIPDLVVGDFGGQFRIYRNLARTGPPKLAPPTYLMAGGVPAKVPIYCCIGSSPQFVDFDGDGRLDLISGSYDPGECYLFRGLGKGAYALRETIVDKNRKPLVRVPKQQQVYQSFGSWPVMVDWDGDGDLDFVIGGFDGTIRVFLNEGTRTNPRFASENFKVQAGGKDLMAPGGHAAPAIVDWDGDGRWDILAGSASGSVSWYRNVGTRTVPRFDAPVILVPEHRGSGYDELREIGQEAVPGIRSQIAAVDYDGDGRVDLLLGDFCLTMTPKPGLTAGQHAELLAGLKERDNIVQALQQKFKLIQAAFKKKYPGDAAYSKQADAEWTKNYFAMHNSNEYKALQSQSVTLDGKLQKLLETPPHQSWVRGLSTCHGYVWFFRRKPIDSPIATNSSGSQAPGRSESPAFARDFPNEISPSEPVVAAATIAPQAAKPGEAVTLNVTIRIASGWHISSIAGAGELSIPTRLELKLPAGLTAAAAWELPKPELGLDKSGPIYTGEVRFSRALKVRPDAVVGTIEVPLTVTYQACDDNHCLRPAKRATKALLEIK